MRPWLLLVLAAGAAVAQVPVFLKHMVDEAADRQVALTASSSWLPTARSVAPLTVVADAASVILEFSVPNDDWSVADRRHCMLVLSPRPAPHSAATTLSVGGDTWRLSQQLPAAGQQFVQFNLTGHVDPRLQQTLRLQLMAADHAGRSVPPGDAVFVAGVELGPLFVVTKSELQVESVSASERARRSSYVPLPGCRLAPWLVRPKQLGWRDIVYPSELLLNLCVGQCPPPVLHASLQPSNHAVARNLFRVLNAGAARQHPDVHCVPIRYRQTSMVLELAEGNYSVVVSRDLSAVDCGCR